ncbi:hypothetical protein K492DRAFT_237512 [Lichtheimia hyalospora FSU 10163]|nr:hypothetical protein K492DRAFT_237512 [Lichtheimia hyalospora FSU 10163]
MFPRACHLHCRARFLVYQRHFASRSGTRSLDDRTKKLIGEVKNLEYKVESQKKRQEAMALLDKLAHSDNGVPAITDAEEIYTQLSAEPISPVRRMVEPDYLEKLRVKFLDTRQALPSDTSQERDDALVNQDQTTLLTCQDYEQLVYVNALAKRPKEAEKAIQLMEENGHPLTVKAYNHLLDAYANTRDLQGALDVFKRIKADELTPDIYTYSTLIKAHIQGAKLKDAFIIFDQLKQAGLIPTQPIFSNLISGCIKSNQIEKAWEVFDSMRLSYHQPDEVTFTLMLHACAKRGEVERALNVFEDMVGSSLYPTDVTFNVLINACAKRPDYFDTAFDLLHQMQNIYGFQPDRITYNTLLSACARKKHLERARDIFQIMMYDAKEQGPDSMLTPDHHTFTNLFMSYANYDPLTTTKKQPQPEQPQSHDALVEHSLISNTLPARRSEVVQEAKKLFDFITSNRSCDMTSALLSSYLSVHVMQKQNRDVVDIYFNTFDKYGVEKTALTYSIMLQYCYNKLDTDMAWRVWGDYQDFLEQRQVLPPQETISKQIKEGWTPNQQKQSALVMINTLAR